MEKKIVIGLLVVLALALGVFAFMRLRAADTSQFCTPEICQFIGGGPGASDVVKTK